MMLAIAWLKKRCTLVIQLLVLLSPLQAVNADSLMLNGQGIHSEFQLNYYLAKLFTTSPKADPEMLRSEAGDQRMEMIILVDEWSTRRFTQHWNQAVLINNSAETRDKFSKELAAFNAMLKGPLLKGDTIKVFKRAGRGMHVTLNGVRLLDFSNDDVFSLLLNTWIGARPPSSDFKASILGEQTIDQSVLTEASTLSPSAERKKKIHAWLDNGSSKKFRDKKDDKAENIEQPIANTPVEEAAIAAASKKNTSATKQAVAKSTVTKVVEAATTTKPQPPATTVSSPEMTKSSAGNAVPQSETEVSDYPEALAKQDQGAIEESSAKRGTSDAVSITSANDENQDTTLTTSSEDTANSPTPATSSDIDEAVTSTPEETATKQENKLLDVYRSNILAMTYQNLIYPASAIDSGHEGKIVLEIVLSRKGKVKKVGFSQKSKHNSLNKAVEKAISDASPYPRPPKKLKGKEIKLVLPITFSLSG